MSTTSPRLVKSLTPIEEDCVNPITATVVLPDSFVATGGRGVPVPTPFGHFNALLGVHRLHFQEQRQEEKHR